MPSGTSNREARLLLVICYLLNSVTPLTQTDVLLQDWAKTGLRVASTVRLSRLDCLEKSLLLAKIGRVSANDAQRLKEVGNLYIKLQF